MTNPEPGIYRTKNEIYEIRISKRGNWYGMRQEPDGSATYVAQNVDTQLMRRQPPCTQCNETAIYDSGLCGTHERQRCLYSWNRLLENQTDN